MTTILLDLKSASFIQVLKLGLIINLTIFFASIILYKVLSFLPKTKVFGEKQEITKEDIQLSLITVVSNTIVFVLGVYLWKFGIIKIELSKTNFELLVEVIILICSMDILMYLFHRFVHIIPFLKQIHARHHIHESTNSLSLFVLSPVESIGFGLMILAVIFIIPFSATSISIYLAINSIWGTIGHLNHSILPKNVLRFLEKTSVCTSEFHYNHHQFPSCNFGFYTSIWDKLFKTEKN
ncbi:MAG: sterol desaturase family protein [Fluviicola sp.]|jgi:lathosterol oxidase